MDDYGEYLEKRKAKALKLRSKFELESQERFEEDYTLDWQGKRITLRKKKHKQSPRASIPRGVIVEFSRRARARRLRRIAEVDWSKTNQSMFITLTYPDEVSDHTMEERKIHRYLFNRWLCKTVGRKMACFWRVEWLPRLSGNFIGELRPHMHLLYLDCPKVCHIRVQNRWREIIGVSRWTQVDCKPLEVADAVSVYVAKYTAKEASSLYLDNVPKRNRSGRHAGELRKNLIPLHERIVVERLEYHIVKWLKSRADEQIWYYDKELDEGFTMLGDQATELIADVLERFIDKEGELA
jgi:hypothetical protein